jgi:hypothetical protein
MVGGAEQSDRLKLSDMSDWSDPSDIAKPDQENDPCRLARQVSKFNG